MFVIVFIINPSLSRIRISFCQSVRISSAPAVSSSTTSWMRFWHDLSVSRTCSSMSCRTYSFLRSGVSVGMTATLGSGTSSPMERRFLIACIWLPDHDCGMSKFLMYGFLQMVMSSAPSSCRDNALPLMRLASTSHRSSHEMGSHARSASPRKSRYGLMKTSLVRRSRQALPPEVPLRQR